MADAAGSSDLILLLMVHFYTWHLNASTHMLLITSYNLPLCSCDMNV